MQVSLEAISTGFTDGSLGIFHREKTFLRITSSGNMYWNTLPDEVIKARSVNVFKKGYDEFKSG